MTPCFPVGDFPELDDVVQDNMVACDHIELSIEHIKMILVLLNNGTSTMETTSSSQLVCVNSSVFFGDLPCPLFEKDPKGPRS